MTWLRKPPLTHILAGVAAAWLLAVIPLAPAHAIWSEYAMVSATMGVSDSRICIGEGSRGDLGCPAYAPTVSATGTLNVTGGLVTDSVSLTTAGTTWGYFTSGASYLPNLNAGSISATNISASTINGVSVSALGAGASPTNVPSFFVTRGGVDQTVTANGYTIVNFTTKVVDTLNNFNTGTSRFTPTVAGNYLFVGHLYCPGSTSECSANIYKNGTLVSRGTVGSSEAVTVNAVILPMNGTSDYVDLRVATNMTTLSGAPDHTYFSGSLLASGNGLISGTGVTTLSGLSDVALSGLSTSQVLTYNGTKWVNSSGASGDRLTSGTLSVTANSGTSVVSLTTGATTWGYFGSAASYLPSLTAAQVSSTAISTTAVQIASVTTVTACSATNAGTLRYNSGNTALELCTGSGWQPMGVGIPAGTISAFASTTCPTGWSEYTPARGRFLRGIDNGAGNDPDGTRSPGNIQEGSLAMNVAGTDNSNRIFNLKGNGSGIGGLNYDSPQSISGFSGTYVQVTGATTGSWGSGTTDANYVGVTRPKNVAVTFCQFNGTSNGWNNPLSGGSTSAAGSTGQIQYNTGGSFDANAGLTWTNASQRLTATNISATALTVNGVAITGSASGDRIASGTQAVIADSTSNTITVSGTLLIRNVASQPCTLDKVGTTARMNGKLYECRL